MDKPIRIEFKVPTITRHEWESFAQRDAAIQQTKDQAADGTLCGFTTIQEHEGVQYNCVYGVLLYRLGALNTNMRGMHINHLVEVNNAQFSHGDYTNGASDWTSGRCAPPTKMKPGCSVEPIIEALMEIPVKGE